jgi:aldose sugar dehydrogenase
MGMATGYRSRGYRRGAGFLVAAAAFASWLHLALSYGAAASPQHAPVPAASAAPLRSATQLHIGLCASCHGEKWEGGRAPSMLDDVWSVGGDDETLARVIREGRLENGMPGFGSVLTPLEVRALVIHIREARAKAKSGPRPSPRPHDGVVVESELETFRIERVAGDLDTPWGLAFLPDGRLLVTERPGRLRVIEPGRGAVGSVSGLPRVWHQQDGGLLDVAVHPDYAKTGWVYLAFSEAGAVSGTSATRVVRGRIRDERWVDEETLFQPTPAQFWSGNIHYGARFFFDRAGFLFYSIGDRGHMGDAQDIRSPYGKLHRVRDDGRAPDDNPFAGTRDALPTVWSYGNRNIQGLARHPVTGELWATEHGPRGGDELNVILPGRNYGWPVITYGMNDDGTPITDLVSKEGMEQPVTHWTPSIGVSSLEFYTGQRFPRWKNHLFMAALSGRQLRRLELDGHTVRHQEVLFSDLGRVRDVVQGPDGFLYVALNMEFASSPGFIVRLVPRDGR